MFWFLTGMALPICITPKLGSGDKVLRRHVDVATDLSEEAGSQITRPVHWDSRYSAVGVTELLVRPALPNLDEAEPFETRDHLAGSQNRQRPHTAFLRDANGFRPDKLGFERRITVLEEHPKDFPEVRAQLLLGLTLAMGAGKARHVPDEEARIGIALYNDSELAHTQLYEEQGHLPNAPELSCGAPLTMQQASGASQLRPKRAPAASAP